MGKGGAFCGDGALLGEELEGCFPLLPDFVFVFILIGLAVFIGNYQINIAYSDEVGSKKIPAPDRKLLLKQIHSKAQYIPGEVRERV
jgi:hypothetical protein